VHWFVCRTRSRFEKTVETTLRDAGIETFAPETVETVRWSDRQNETRRPLFPGYVFFRGSRQQCALAVTARGVVQILGIGSPESIPDAEIANLQRMAANPEALAPCAYVAGESVTVKCGNYAGVSGVVVRTNGSTHLVVSIELLGRACRVPILATDVEAFQF
jgi:transcription antitermination factor NusG